MVEMKQKTDTILLFCILIFGNRTQVQTVKEMLDPGPGIKNTYPQPSFFKGALPACCLARYYNDVGSEHVW
jgi:hypothetical protein